MKNIFAAFTFCVLFLSATFSALSQNNATNSVVGFIFDETTKKNLPRATIRIEGTNQGTFSDKNGKFILPKHWLNPQSKLKISYLSYDTKILPINEKIDTINVYLKPSAVQISQVNVTGEITAEEIIIRAIARKAENAAKIQTMQGLLYSKLSLDMRDLTNSAARVSGNSVSITLKTAENKEKDSLGKLLSQGFIIENFSLQYLDKSQNINKTEIIQRRQTANMPANSNILTLQNFINFGNEEVRIFDNYFVAPLNKNALSYYNFKILERKVLDDRFVYVMEMLPNTRLSPTFIGKICIVEGTYDLVEIDLHPSDESKIQFVENLRFYEKFEEIEPTLWYPTLYEVNFDVGMNIIALLPKITFSGKTTAVVSDIAINKPLPDSVYTLAEETKNSPPIISATADSVSADFWAKNSIVPLSDEEQIIYSEVDTAAKQLNFKPNELNLDSMMQSKNDEFFLNLNAFNYIEYNRVMGYKAGAGLILGWDFANISGGAGYSFGQKKLFWDSKITLKHTFGENISIYNANKSSNAVTISASAGLFSNSRTFSQSYDKNSMISSFTTAYLFHWDCYDYYKADGWNVGIKSTWKLLNIAASYENIDVSSLTKTTDKSLFSKSIWRENPFADEGKYEIFNAKISLGTIENSISNNFQYEIRAAYKHGWNRTNVNEFNAFHATGTALLPLTQVGFGRIYLLLTLSGGISSQKTPVHEQFCIDKTAPLSFGFGTNTKLFCTSYEEYFGGNEFFAAQGKLNLRDIWWRTLGLPLYNGRGIELFISGAAGKFFNKTASELYKSTPNDFYSEVGFGFARIPTFITDLLNWSIEVRRGIGKYASGYGFVINIDLPF